MSNLNNIGLDKDRVKNEAELLDELLANYSVFYQNTRGYHWNLTGHKFFELHVKFEELYNDLFTKIDEIAERIRTLGYFPSYKFSDYFSKSAIKETSNTKDGFKAVEEILVAFSVLLEKQRKILKLSDELGDEGTNAQMSDYITEQEKLVWMYSAYLG